VRIAQDRFGEGAHKQIMHDTLADRSDLIVRKRGVYDGAMPSAVGTWLNALVDLHQETGERWYLEYAVMCLGAVSRAVKRSPVGCIESVRALFRLMELDGSLPSKLGPAEEEREVESPVVVMAAAERADLRESDEVRVPLRIEIGGGYHVNAAELPEKLVEIGLRPLGVRVERGTGVEASLAFPPAETYRGGALDEDTRRDFGELSVYSGNAQGELVLRRTAGEAITGRPTVVMEYQVCSDESCYSPMSVELDVEIVG
jgi:hypothetical protein